MTAKRSKRRDRRAAAKADTRVARPGSTAATNDISLASALGISIALLMLVGIVYAPVGGYQFTSLDDPQYVSANPMVLNGFTSAGLRQAFSLHGSFYWHPLTWMSHMLDVQLFGVDAGAHHAVNAVLHGLNTVLLFLALRSMTRSDTRSAFVAALFALHPLHVESVAWIAERKDVLSTFFLMAALYAYAENVKRPRLLRRVLVAALFLLGLLAKPMIATFPFVLLLLDYWPLSRTSKGWPALISEKLELFLLAAASVVATILSQRGSRAVVALESLSLPARIANSLVSYVLYMRDMIWPARLAAFYPLVAPTAIIAVISAVILVAITVVVLRLRRSLPFLTTGWLWFLGSLVPVIGLVQAGDQGRADRFTYVPLIGLFIALTWLCAFAADRWKIGIAARYAAAIVIVASLCFVTRQQLSYWKDDLSLWERAVDVTSGNYRAEEHYGVALTGRGRLADGIQHYEAALRIWPEYPEAHNNLGAARMDQGNYALAITEFTAAVKAKPGDPNYRYNLAVALDAGGRRKDAIDQVRLGLQANPAYPDLLRAAEVFGMRTR